MDIKIDFSNIIGRIKPLHGVNNGPVCFGSLIDISKYYKELGIPYARLHDPNWPNPREVDIPQIFPDFDADPSEPSNYDFKRTDAYLQSILKLGTKVIYRLGVSIEHTSNKYYIHPPKDFSKWAKVCINIIRHYNDGWADGFQYGIQYWEIWNEPDYFPDGKPEKSNMWTGTFEQYMNLYKTAATTIKKYNKQLKVGGIAAAFVQTECTEKFLTFVEKEKLPLDFFSWHTYTDNPEIILKNSRIVRHLLDMHGLQTTESHCNEWNYIQLAAPNSIDIFAQGNELYRRKTFEKTKGMEGASFAAAVLSLFQNGSVNIANYYDGQPTNLYCGLYDCYGVPMKPYYAFKAFSKLYGCGNQAKVEISAGNDGLYCCSAINESDDAAYILLSNFNAGNKVFSVKPKGIAGKGSYLIEQYLLDERNNLDLVKTETCYLDDFELNLYMDNQTVRLVKLSKV